MLSADAEAMMREWGEEISYSPAGGTPRAILAIVDRDVPRDVAGAGGETVIRPATTIEVLNRSTSEAQDGFGGIGSSEMDTGGDKVSVSRRIGETPREMRIAQLLEQDEAMLTLEVR